MTAVDQAARTTSDAAQTPIPTSERRSEPRPPHERRGRRDAEHAAGAEGRVQVAGSRLAEREQAQRQHDVEDVEGADARCTGPPRSADENRASGGLGEQAEAGDAPSIGRHVLGCAVVPGRTMETERRAALPSAGHGGERREDGARPADAEQDPAPARGGEHADSSRSTPETTFVAVSSSGRARQRRASPRLAPAA